MVKIVQVSRTALHIVCYKLYKHDYLEVLQKSASLDTPLIWAQRLQYQNSWVFFYTWQLLLLVWDFYQVPEPRCTILKQTICRYPYLPTSWHQPQICRYDQLMKEQNKNSLSNLKMLWSLTNKMISEEELSLTAVTNSFFLGNEIYGWIISFALPGMDQNLFHRKGSCCWDGTQKGLWGMVIVYFLI